MLCRKYAENMQKICRNYAKICRNYAKIMQKKCKYYAEIMQKLCKKLKICRKFAEIMQKVKNMQKVCRNYAKSYAKLCKNYAMFPACMYYAKIMQIMQKLCKLCKSPKIMQITHPPLALCGWWPGPAVPLRPSWGWPGPRAGPGSITGTVPWRIMILRLRAWESLSHPSHHHARARQ